MEAGISRPVATLTDVVIAGLTPCDIAFGVRETHVLTVRETVSRSAIYPKIAGYRTFIEHCCRPPEQMSLSGQRQ